MAPSFVSKIGAKKVNNLTFATMALVKMALLLVVVVAPPAATPGLQVERLGGAAPLAVGAVLAQKAPFGAPPNMADVLYDLRVARRRLGRRRRRCSKRETKKKKTIKIRLTISLASSEGKCYPEWTSTGSGLAPGASSPSRASSSLRTGSQSPPGTG